MTTMKEVELGEDIKNLVVNHPDFFNESDTKVSDLDDDILYMVEKHIGFYEPKKRSGIFILSIQEVTEELIARVL